MRMRLILAGLLTALPLMAQAEGARIILACAVMQSCTPEGACDPAMGEAADYIIAPDGADADGVGRYIVTREGTELVAGGLSPVGPFAWTAPNGDRLSLVLSTERTALLSRNPAAPDALPHVDFLICEITA